MSRYSIHEITRLWALENITTEQTIGQLLQHMQDLLDRISTIEKRLNSTRNNVRSGGQSESPTHSALDE